MALILGLGCLLNQGIVNADNFSPFNVINPNRWFDDRDNDYHAYDNPPPLPPPVYAPPYAVPPPVTPPIYHPAVPPVPVPVTPGYPAANPNYGNWQYNTNYNGYINRANNGGYNPSGQYADPNTQSSTEMVDRIQRLEQRLDNVEARGYEPAPVPGVVSPQFVPAQPSYRTPNNQQVQPNLQVQPNQQRTPEYQVQPNYQARPNQQNQSSEQIQFDATKHPFRPWGLQR
ncbi:hypothetical protein TI04_04170 [Achromatium sp. WMS2]|nr:hypothetical protein TI04_04170 [Achromatium sp. WMS2]